MIPIAEINEILLFIKDLPIKESLIYFVSRGIFDYSKDKFGKLKQAIIDKQNLSNFAFVPDKEEAKNSPYLEKCLALKSTVVFFDIPATYMPLFKYFSKINLNAPPKPSTAYTPEPKNERFIKVLNIELINRR